MRLWQLRWFPILILLYLATGAFGMTPEKAKDELAKKDIAFTEEAFLREAWKGDTGTVKLFLQAGMDPNSIDQKGNTALIVAAKEGRQEVVGLLLEHGADI